MSNILKIESAIEKFLFLNFYQYSDIDEALKVYVSINDIKVIISDRDNILDYINCKRISNRNKNILIMKYIKINFNDIKTTPLEWLNSKILKELDNFIVINSL